MTIVTGVDFVCIPTQDIEAARRYYGEVLGLEASSLWQKGGEEPLGAEFETGTVTLSVIKAEAIGIPFQPNSVPVALHVDDIEAARADLTARGVELPETIDSGVCHMINFRDPEGNALMLHHRYAPREG